MPNIDHSWLEELRDQNRWLRERVASLEAERQSLTDRLLTMQREGWVRTTDVPTPAMAAVARAVLPAAIIAAIQQRANLAPGGASQLLSFATTQLAAGHEEGDVLRTIMEGVSDA